MNKWDQHMNRHHLIVYNRVIVDLIAKFCSHSELKSTILVIGVVIWGRGCGLGGALGCD